MFKLKRKLTDRLNEISSFETLIIKIAKLGNFTFINCENPDGLILKSDLSDNMTSVVSIEVSSENIDTSICRMVFCITSKNNTGQLISKGFSINIKNYVDHLLGRRQEICISETDNTPGNFFEEIEYASIKDFCDPDIASLDLRDWFINIIRCVDDVYNSYFIYEASNCRPTFRVTSGELDEYDF